MANDKKDENQPPTACAERVKPSAAESLKRMKAFRERKAAFVAAVRLRSESRGG
jgi:hypothetical protein